MQIALEFERPLTDEGYFEFCMANPDLNLERTPAGAIVIMPWPGGESAFRELAVGSDLLDWAKRDRRGKPFGSTAQFLLPDGSGLSPDAAWVSNESIAKLSKAEKRRFLRVTPEFVIEVLSPSDRLAASQKKMRVWAANGVELGWLIDGDNRHVYVYRGTAEPRLVAGADVMHGEGPVEGFTLPLTDV